MNTKANDIAPGISTINHLNVHFCEGMSYNTPLEHISASLTEQEKIPLTFAPWPQFPYKPQVAFSLLHSGDSVFLKYFVSEQYLAAAHGATNAPVYKDSCVEFFISFDEQGYYNFEFNCTGTCLAGFGKGREQRQLLPDAVLAGIRSQATITREDNETVVAWTITLVIPVTVFVFHHLPSLRGKEVRANFYKCGDDLPDPHYLAWTDIVAPEPDFHLPQYFGTVIFK